MVDLPTDAKLYVFGEAKSGSAAQRTFKTPELPKLEAGYGYYYDIRAEVVRDGKTYGQTRRLKVRAGETSKAKFTETELVKSENEVNPAVTSAK
jgi:uncharacterized protein (TIGR03000 family)